MKKLLVIIDYQNDFVDGTLGFPQAVVLEKHIAQAMRTFKEKNQDIILTKDTHNPNYLNTQEGENLPVAHCIKGTPGHDFYGEIDLLSKGCKIIEKPAFPSLELGEYLKGKDYDEITVMGIVSHICVISNCVIIKAALPEAKIIVDTQGIASFDEKLHKEALDVMSQGLQITLK